MTPLAPLFQALANALDGNLEIELLGRKALLEAADSAFADATTCPPVPDDIAAVMNAGDAHPVCTTILTSPIPWMIPKTSDTPEYFEVSQKKIIAELVGPNGVVKRDGIRVGVYGISPGVDYGIRSHPAEEIFVLLAGHSDWLSGDERELKEYGPGTRRHHLSMMPHATRTRDSAFMSIYVWTGDVSYENYVYTGGTGGGNT